MKTITWLLSFALWGAVSQTYNFDSAKPGTLPPGWTAVVTNTARWQVLRDPTAPSPPYVLALTSNPAAGRCPLAILDKMIVKDGDLSVKVKPVSGREDRAGGLVWRYQDPNNYYLVRANALENNIVLYKIEGGRRTPLVSKGAAPMSYGISHTVPANQWSVLKVQFRGPLFSVYFNHKRLFQVQDTTFSQAGKVGLWTKSDSVIYFDDFRIAGK